MLHGDSQPHVDQFIRTEKPTGLPAETNNSITGKPETVYTRLRNEFAHNRKGRGDDLSNTKRDVSARVSGLKQLIAAGVCVFFYLEDRERTFDSPPPRGTTPTRRANTLGRASNRRSGG